MIGVRGVLKNQLDVLARQVLVHLHLGIGSGLSYFPLGFRCHFWHQGEDVYKNGGSKPGIQDDGMRR